jgi:hypothetical protein
MAYTKAKLKSGDYKASPCFRPLWIGKLSEKCLPIWIPLYISFKHILMDCTTFMGTPSSMRISGLSKRKQTFFLKHLLISLLNDAKFTTLTHYHY